MIGEHGQEELEGALHDCGIKPGFERGFCGLMLGHTVADLAQLMPWQATSVLHAARLMGQRETQARLVHAANQALTPEQVIAEGEMWLGGSPRRNP